MVIKEADVGWVLFPAQQACQHQPTRQSRNWSISQFSQFLQSLIFLLPCASPACHGRCSLKSHYPDASAYVTGTATLCTILVAPHRHPCVGPFTSSRPPNVHRSLDRRPLSSVEASSPDSCPLACLLLPTTSCPLLPLHSATPQEQATTLSTIATLPPPQWPTHPHRPQRASSAIPPSTAPRRPLLPSLRARLFPRPRRSMFPNAPPHAPASPLAPLPT